MLMHCMASFSLKNYMYQLLEHCAIMSNSTEINTNVVRKVRLSLRNFRLSLINDLGQRLEHATNRTSRDSDPALSGTFHYIVSFSEGCTWHQLEMKRLQSRRLLGSTEFRPLGFGDTMFCH